MGRDTTAHSDDNEFVPTVACLQGQLRLREAQAQGAAPLCRGCMADGEMGSGATDLQFHIKSVMKVLHSTNGSNRALFGPSQVKIRG